MAKTNFLDKSLSQLIAITEETHNEQIKPIAKAIWQKDLNPNNPLWKHIIAQPYYIENKNGAAHMIAMVDKRLPGIGLVGYFACTNAEIGAEVLGLGVKWLKDRQGIKNVYGPINGTITRDYRLNLSDDFQVPGEPVNPVWYIDVFRNAGFKVFNRYVTGISKHYLLSTKLLTMRKPAPEYTDVILRPFNTNKQMEDLKVYHELMNDIFPHNSIYCPVLTWDERVYNVAGHNPIFDPNYSYFLEHKGKAIGFIIAYKYQENLVVKTIALLPKYRNKNLSGLLIKKVHVKAYRDGLKAAIYSTIRVGNAVYEMKQPGMKIYRKYITMHKAI